MNNITKGVEFNRAITSKDVAKLAGVSQSSVSRTFNTPEGRGVKPEIREKVLQAASELGYRPNLLASSMSSGRTNLIALVVGEQLGPFYNSIIHRFLEEIQASGRQCLVFKVARQGDIKKIIEKVIQYQVDGIIITASAMDKVVVETVKNNDVPVVLFNKFIPGLAVNMVYSDPVEGGRLAAQHLYEAGANNIAYVSYTKESSEEVEKKIGFYSELRQKGVFSIAEDASEYDYDGGVEAGRRLFSENENIDAVFCTSDLVALGIIDVAKNEFGINVPEDVKIMGYDNIHMGTWQSYSLTTIKQPIDEMVKMAVAMIEESVENSKTEQRVEMFAPELIVRKSSAPQSNKALQ